MNLKRIEMVKKVVAKPLSKIKMAKKIAKDEQIQSLVLRQSYIPLEVDEQLRKLVQIRGVRMNELIRGIIEDTVARMIAISPEFEIQKTPEPEIDYYVQERDKDEWLNLLMTRSEIEARNFIKLLDRSRYSNEIRLVRAYIEKLIIEEDTPVENKA